MSINCDNNSIITSLSLFFMLQFCLFSYFLSKLQDDEDTSVVPQTVEQGYQFSTTDLPGGGFKF